VKKIPAFFANFLPQLVLSRQTPIIKENAIGQQENIILYVNFLCEGESIIHSFSSLSYDRSKASSKASSPHSAIQSFLFQMRVAPPFLKVIQ